MNEGVLITGATSKLGANLVEKLLEESHYTLWLLIRKNPQEPNIKNRFKKFVSAPYHHYLDNRVRVFEGDLRNRQLGIPDKYYEQMLNSNITQVFHLAGLTDRNQFTKDNLFSTNFDGTNRLLNLAQKLNVKVFNYMGQLYSCGKVENVSKESYMEFMEDNADYNNINEFVERVVTHQVISRLSNSSMAFRIFNPAYFVDLQSIENTSNRWYWNFLALFYEMKMGTLEVYGQEYLAKNGVNFYASDVSIYMTDPKFLVKFITKILDDKQSHNKIFNIYSDLKKIRPLITMLAQEVLGIKINFVNEFNKMNSLERKICDKSTTFFEYLQQKKVFEIDMDFENFCRKYGLKNSGINDEDLLELTKLWVLEYEKVRNSEKLPWYSKLALRTQDLIS